MKENYFYYSWEEFNQDVFILNKRIFEINFFPDLIVGVKRGGLVPAVSLSHLLKKPMELIDCQLRDGYKNPEFLFECSRNKKILVVDDICDDGDTFSTINILSNKLGYKNIAYCCIFYNIRQNFNVNIWARKIDRYKDKSWIVFPWEL